MKKINYKDLGMRALKTFIQGAVASLGYTLTTTDFTNKEAIKALIIGAIASGASALMNFINGLLKKEG